MGDYRYDVRIINQDKEVRAKLRGSIRKRSRIKIGDYVIASIRNFQDNVVDIIHVYNDSEKMKLIQYNEITPQKRTQENQQHEIVFEDI